jgi:LmbE family N-acetylglucosaminyl deacetylase
VDGNDETMAVREESNHRCSRNCNRSGALIIVNEFLSWTREEVLKICRAIFLVIVTVTLGCSSLRAQLAVSPGTGRGLPETVDAIESARVATRILYITAHPDDESGAVLTYLARGLHADVALLSLTRGEGGQNTLGPEQAPQLGLIRTQELLAATRGYGVKLYFTSAKDFGYSKTPEETEKVWGDQVLDDVVYRIRDFRPNVIINGWGGVHSGHGHHQAAGVLTPRAVQLAADESYKTKASCDDCGPWTTSEVLDLERGSDQPHGYILPLDEISPTYGRTWRQLGIDAFANHRTQGITGFLGSTFLQRPIGLHREDGKLFDPKSLAVNIAERFKGCTPIEIADRDLESSREAVLQLAWKRAGEKISHAAALLSDAPKKCGPTPFSQKEEAWEQLLDRTAASSRIDKAAGLVAGLDVSALADRNNVTAGEEFRVVAHARCRAEADCKVGESKLVSISALNQTKREGDLDKGQTFTIQVQDHAGSAPGLIGSFSSPDSQYQNAATPAPISEVWIRFRLAGHEYLDREAVKFFDANSTHADLVPLQVVPSYALAVEPKQSVEILPGRQHDFDVLLRVHSYSGKSATVSVGLDAPSGWKTSGTTEVKFDGIGDRYGKVKVTPPAQLPEGNLTIGAYARRGEEKFTTSIEPLPSMPTLLWEEPAQCAVYAFAINVPKNLHIGYITAESEPVPDALKMLGIQVDMLDPATLAFGDLSKYDAVVVGIRAYELRSDLPGANQRLFDYVSNGGTMLVQYERDFAWTGKNFAPYPAQIASNKPGDPLPRITDETAAVTFLKPDDVLLNAPNKITEQDFAGWVQERGLYYWTDFDPRYTALLSMHDPGEKDLNGGLVYTRYGKGTYIYTGLAFFRQLPEGVPGAYRLFVNLLSASRPQ